MSPRRFGLTIVIAAVSVLAVFASAVGFANRRQAQAELSQVLDEARSEARSLVDGFRPGKAGPVQRGKKPPAFAALPGGIDGRVALKTSRTYDGFGYEIAFAPVVRDVPEAGFRTAITVRWGDQQSYTESLTLLPTSIPDGEFDYSATFQEEEQDRADGKTREAK